MPTENTSGGQQSFGQNGFQRHHIRHEGLVAGPTAGGPARVIRLHDAYEEERVECVANSWNGPPIIPSYVAPDSNHVFLGGARANNSPPPDGVNGRHHWSLTAAYSYLIIAPVGLGSAFPSAKLAGDGTLENANEATIPSTSFQVTPQLLGTAQT